MKPVNLNQFRKTKARAEKKARADANAVKFGRSKAEKDAVRKEQTTLAIYIDAHKRAPEDE